MCIYAREQYRGALNNDLAQIMKDVRDKGERINPG